jgi:hypothetical protein
MRSTQQLLLLMLLKQDAVPPEALSTARLQWPAMRLTVDLQMEAGLDMQTTCQRRHRGTTRTAPTGVVPACPAGRTRGSVLASLSSDSQRIPILWTRRLSTASSMAWMNRYTFMGKLEFQRRMASGLWQGWGQVRWGW